MKRKKIERLAQYHKELEFEMPDKYMSKFIEVGLVKILLEDIDNYARASVKKNLCRVFTYLCNHRDCRAYILKCNGMEKAIQMANEDAEETTFEAIRLIQAL